MAVATHGIIVGRVVRVRDHPNGERIWLADVDLGRGDPVQIVFGGKKEAIGPESLVPVAPPGSRLDGVKMRRRRYRGEASHGMLCSLAELGWDPSVTDRVAVLATSARLQPGQCIDDRVKGWESIILNPRVERVPKVWARWPVRTRDWYVDRRGSLRLLRSRSL